MAADVAGGRGDAALLRCGYFNWPPMTRAIIRLPASSIIKTANYLSFIFLHDFLHSGLAILTACLIIITWKALQPKPLAARPSGYQSRRCIGMMRIRFAIIAPAAEFGITIITPASMTLIRRNRFLLGRRVRLRRICGNKGTMLKL